MRIGKVNRATKETRVEVELNLFAAHEQFDLKIIFAGGVKNFCGSWRT